MASQPTWLASIGWPHVSLIFSIAFILIYRKELAAMLGKVKSVSKDGITINPEQEAHSFDQQRQVIHEMMSVDQSPMLEEVERSIMDDLKRKGLEIDSDSAKVLSKHLAATQIALEFEQIDSLIFGSQITLLRRLNEAIGTGLSESFVALHCNVVRTSFPALTAWTDDRYMCFLYSKGLLVSREGTLHITAKGAEFLVWLIRTGRKEDRGL